MIPVPLKPDVTNKTCLSPIAAVSGPAFSYAPAPRSDRGCLKNSLIGNSNIREVSTNFSFSSLCFRYTPAGQPAQKPQDFSLQAFVFLSITPFRETVTTM